MNPFLFYESFSMYMHTCAPLAPGRATQSQIFLMDPRETLTCLLLAAFLSSLFYVYAFSPANPRSLCYSLPFFCKSTLQKSHTGVFDAGRPRRRQTLRHHSPDTYCRHVFYEPFFLFVFVLLAIYVQPLAPPCDGNHIVIESDCNLHVYSMCMVSCVLAEPRTEPCRHAGRAGHMLASLHDALVVSPTPLSLPPLSMSYSISSVTCEGLCLFTESTLA